MKSILKWLFGVTVACTALLFIYSYFLPETIAIQQGSARTLNFFLPLRADFSGGDVGVLKANNRPVSENIHIDLSNTVIEGEERGRVDMNVSLFGLPIKNISLTVLPADEYIPCGETVGIVIDTDGVLVLGTGSVKDRCGSFSEPCRGILKSGDLIKSVNGSPVFTKEELQAAVKKSPYKAAIKIDRLEEPVDITPVIAEDGTPMLGLWVRDSTQGIGTVTYYKKDDLTFGALGHPVTDVDTGGIMQTRGGEIYTADIKGVVKGEKGHAGELSGSNMGNVIGKVEKNCGAGIYGKLDASAQSTLGGRPMPIALKSQVKRGAAKILADVDGKGVKEYSIEIESINNLSKNTGKGMTIKITDNDLIKKTGGIVQGMSGSPIIQNGCLVGAVTHVFVQNPTKGYGIFVENMICEGEK